MPQREPNLCAFSEQWRGHDDQSKTHVGDKSFVSLLAFCFPQASNLGDLVRNGEVAAVTSALAKGAAINEIEDRGGTPELRLHGILPCGRNGSRR